MLCWQLSYNKLYMLQDAASRATGSERTAAAREAEADALCKENTALKQQLRSLQQDCGRSRGALHAASAELAQLKSSFRQVQCSSSLGLCLTDMGCSSQMDPIA